MVVQESVKKAHSYQWVDVSKFFFCICIIAMHSNLPFKGIYWIEKLLFRLGVPFFFAASGFFLSMSYKTRGYKAAIQRYCFRLLDLLVVFSVIWILQFWIDCTISKTSVITALLQTIQQILFLPKNALWYIQASIVVALLLTPFIKRERFFVAIMVGIVLYSFALLCNNYYFLVQDTMVCSVIDAYTKLFLAPHNGFFVGFLYLALGVFAERSLSSWPAATLNLLLGFSYVLFIGEVIFVSRYATKVDDGAFYIMLIAIAPLLLSVLIKLPECFDSRVTVLMRRLSTGMYLLHLPLMWCYHRFCSYLLPSIPFLKRGQAILWNGYVKFVVILLCSWAICVFAYRHTKIIKRFLM